MFALDCRAYQTSNCLRRIEPCRNIYSLVANRRLFAASEQLGRILLDKVDARPAYFCLNSEYLTIETIIQYVSFKHILFEDVIADFVN